VVEMGWSQNSLITRCIALRKFFEFCRLQGYSAINEVLIPIPRKEYNIPRVTNKENYQKLIDVIPRDSNDPRHIRNLAIIGLLWDTGARNGEILSLDVGDVDTIHTKAVIRTEKNRGSRPFREIFWTEETNKNLTRWIKKRGDLAKRINIVEPDALFISACTVKIGHRFSIKGVGEMLRRYSNKAQIPYMNAHSFRHHMGHSIINNGGSAADVMNILGHASLASSTPYTMMFNKELENRCRYFQQKELSTPRLDNVLIKC